MVKMLESSKGITPVIAIVLLLLVTVGAVGVVYTQFQEIAGGDTSFETQARNTHVQIDALSSSNDGDNITMVYTNRDDSVTISNTSERLQILYKPNEDSDYTSYDAIDGISDSNLDLSTNGEEDRSCVTDDDAQSLEPGETRECDLGVMWPDSTESFGVQVAVRGADNSDALECTVSTGNDVSCS